MVRTVRCRSGAEFFERPVKNTNGWLAAEPRAHTKLLPDPDIAVRSLEFSFDDTFLDMVDRSVVVAVSYVAFR